MFRLPTEHLQTLRDLRDTSDNPFYWLERRRENRNGEPWKGVWNALFLLAIVFGIVLGGVWVILREDVFPEVFVNGRIPGWLGGGDGGRAAFALVAATHSLLIYYSARSLANRLLASEARRGSLFQLLLARLPAFEMVLEMTVYPFQQAMLIALAGLPLYAVLVGFGSVGFQEVLVLYLLFAVMAVAVPNWRTPAFAEQSPEEVGQLLRDQERAAGCVASFIAFAALPGSIMLGMLLNWAHSMAPMALARIPAEVWPALPAFPLTFAWVTVRILTAPYTWFGLPLPPWVFSIPILLLYRLASLWQVSFYLRVSHPAQIQGLPDVLPLARYRAAIRQVILIGLVGYLWQPFIETEIIGALVWPNATNTAPENLSAFYYFVSIPAFLASMARARATGSLTPRGCQAAGRSIAWVYTPFLAVGISLLFGAAGMPEAFFTARLAGMLLALFAPIAAMLYFGASLGTRERGEWQALYLLPPFLGFFRWTPAGSLTCLSPLMVPLVANPALVKWSHQPGSWYHIPPWWAAVVVPLAAGAVCQMLASRGLLVKRSAEPARTAMRVKMGEGTGRRPVPAEAVTQSMPAVKTGGSAPHLDFVLDQPPKSSINSAMGAGPTLAPAAQAAPPQPVPYRTQEILPHPASGVSPPPSNPSVPVPPPFSHAGSGDAVVHPPDRADYSGWRWRPLSPLASALLRWLCRKTDNPVALYSARRVLPGTLKTEQITMALVVLGLLMLVGYLLPVMLLYLVMPAVVTAFLLPPESIIALILRPGTPHEQVAGGMALVVGLMVGVTLLSPWSICKFVADGFRMERERSTLGFLLMTPLSSRGVALGHCMGALLPALAIWMGCALFAVIPAALMAGLSDPLPAIWLWGYGFFVSLMYLGMCTVVGMWIGITEVKARDMTIGVYLLPFSFCLVAGGCAFYTFRYWQWGYFQYNALFVGLCVSMTVLLWRNAMKELQAMRRGDLPFEGRTISN